jgi:hypothetical protein
MRKLRIIGIAIIAALAISAVASSAASAALPEFEGNFPRSFQGSNTTNTVNFMIASAGETWVACQGDKIKGLITSAKGGTVTTELEHCAVPASRSCHTAGAAEGHIVLSGAAELVYLEKAKKTVAIAQQLGTTHLLCAGGVELTVQGHDTINKNFEEELARLITPITPVNTTTTTFTLSIQQSAGVQAVTAYENSAGVKVSRQFLELKLSEFQQMGLGFSTNPILTMSAPMKINA